MKRLAVFILIVVLMCGINFAFTQDLTLGNLFPNAKVEVYLKNYHNDFISSVKNGDGQIVFCGINDLNYILKNYDALGFTIKLVGSVEQVINNINPLYTVFNNESVYGYKANLFNVVLTKGGFANFQCVQRGNVVHMGVPILLGSY